MASQKTKRVPLQRFETYSHAAREAKAFALRYRETVDVKTEDGFIVIFVSEAARDRWQREQEEEARASESGVEVPTSGTSDPSRSDAGETKARLTPIAARTHMPVEEVEPSSATMRVKHDVVATVIEVDRDGGARIASLGGPQRSETISQLIDELQHAYRNAPASEMADWSKASVMRLGTSFVRRVANLGRLATRLGRFIGVEASDIARATAEGRTTRHLRERAARAGQATKASALSATREVGKIIHAFRREPGKVGSELMVTALAFYCAGGGLDGDGGIPDTDIALFGIGGHRSIFTHSIIAGAVVEASIFSLYDLVRRAHAYLPAQRHPIWDRIHNGFQGITSAAARGSSAGLAYHFGVDSVLQPAAYHDLPFSAPLDVHQTIMGLNAVAEGAPTKKTTTRNADSVRTSASVKRERSEIASGLAAAAALLLVGIGLS